jgi:ribulose-bisphosphate carboxylase large chain
MSDEAWFADSTLDRSRCLFATNIIETDAAPCDAAAHLAQEQSTAQWKRPGVDEDFRKRHGAKVVSLRVLRLIERPSAPTLFDGPGPWKQCEVVIAHPLENFGAKIPNLLSVLLGEGAFYSPGIAAVRLTDITFPDAWAEQFPGPRFGVAGLRDLLNVHDRPFFMGVVKPNIGLTPAEFAALAEEGWKGGLDVAKDDEMLPDAPWSPLAERARLCGAARKRAEAATGERKMYVANATDEIGALRRHHDDAVAGGANALLLNTIPLGISAARYVREFSQVPILGHFAMSAALSRSPSIGVDSSVLTLLQRLAGCDVILFAGTGARMRTSYEEMRSNIEACRRPLGRIAASLPVPGGSSRPADVGATLAGCGGVDFGLVAGRAVFNHPDGPFGGAKSFRQAWEAVQDDVPLEEKARTSPELARSLAAFGS